MINISWSEAITRKRVVDLQAKFTTTVEVNDKKAAARDAATDSLHRKYHAEFCVSDQRMRQCARKLFRRHKKEYKTRTRLFLSSFNIISHVAAGKIERKSSENSFLSFHSLATLSGNFEL
jgi:hypothetical protein